uniref:NR LBD domain-containing protein n=1 Tax=Steinernema glaseri TaxID=37863 RepID=A0A1I8A0Q4_9BILA
MGCTFSAKARHAQQDKTKHEIRKRSRVIPFSLTDIEKEMLRNHWIRTVLVQEPNLFLKAMVASIKDSPKLLDIISCRMSEPGCEHIEEWPKLIRMAKGNCAFFTKQIVRNNLDEALVRKDGERLGSIHITYAPYGFKTTFLDIWQSNIYRLLGTVQFPTALDQLLFLKAFKVLCSFLCTLMVIEYEVSMQSRTSSFARLVSILEASIPSSGPRLLFLGFFFVESALVQLTVANVCSDPTTITMIVNITNPNPPSGTFLFKGEMVNHARNLYCTMNPLFSDDILQRLSITQMLAALGMTR